MEEALIKRVLPHSLEAEQSVIGSMLMDREAVIAASEIITGSDFYQQQYGIMFDAMVELFNEGKPVDLVTLQDRLKEKDVPIITVTRFAENELTRLADCKLYVSAKELLVRTAATASRISQLNIIDILFTAYVKNNYEKNISRLKSNVITKDII